MPFSHRLRVHPVSEECGRPGSTPRPTLSDTRASSHISWLKNSTATKGPLGLKKAEFPQQPGLLGDPHPHMFLKLIQGRA